MPIIPQASPDNDSAAQQHRQIARPSAVCTIPSMNFRAIKPSLAISYWRTAADHLEAAKYGILLIFCALLILMLILKAILSAFTE